MDTARILIVDDQIHALKGVSRILTSAGYDTFEANSGEDCLKLAAEHKPDLILLDVVLPDIDGKEVCRRIKSNPETADSYVVLFSSIQVESDRQAEGLEQGADGYIARPIPNRELLARVKSILRLKRAENRLSESEEKYRNIFNSAGVGMFRSRLDGSEILDLNDKFLQILNQTREDVIGKPSVIVWADPHEREKMVRSLNTDGKVTDAEIRVLTGEGDERTCLNSAKLYPDKGIIEGYVVDITERKRTEENVLASEQRLGAITNSAFDAIILINDSGEISYWNPASERIFGYRDSEVMGKNVHELLAPPEFHAAYRSAFKDFVTTGRGNAMGKITALVARRKDGEEFPIELSLSGFQVGGSWHAAGIVRDITERKHVDQRILNVLAYAENIINTVREPLVVLDGEMRVVSANDSFYHMFGVTSEETQGNLLYNLGNRQWDIPRLHELLEEILPEKAEVRDFEVDYVFPGIGHKMLFLNGRQVISALGEEGRKLILLAVEDVTERKRLEEERLDIQRKLLHVQKLESLGVMAGGIAHDFNNLLQVVLGNLELALTDLPPDLKVRKSILNAIKAADRSAELSGQMLTYSGSSFYLPKDIHLDELLNKSRNLFKLGVPKNVTLNIDVSKTVPHIKGDVDQIQRVITNLLTNSSESIGDSGGAITIRTGVMDCDEMYLSRSRPVEHSRPGRFVFLEVTDTGCGMNAETQHKIFDPFFSTKFWGRGLGMAEVIGVVTGHRGSIIVDSEVGKGTTVRVLFPVSEKIQEAPVQVKGVVETELPVPDSITRRKTILVVDDEEMVRGLVSRRLDSLGYDMIEASDGDEGVHVFQERLNEIDLVLLDFAMPKMNGVEAFGELIRIKPDVKVILSSGYTEDAVMQSFPGQRPSGVLHKPYKTEDLKGELERLLGATD